MWSGYAVRVKPIFRSRIIREAVKWNCMVCVPLCAMLWLRSWPPVLIWTHKSGLWIDLHSGYLSFGRVAPPPPRFDPSYPWAGGEDSLQTWWFYAGSMQHKADVSLHLAYIAGASVLITAIAVRREGMAIRRQRAGHCVKCGYDRAGLASDAACPECGTLSKP